MKIAIMQPYFFPYLGYFQLINSVDEFVIYDNIEFTKKGWINRNRILVNGSDAKITLPLKKGSDFLHINERYLSETWDVDRKKMLNRITESYRKATYFKEVYPIVEECIMYDDRNLFNFILHSLQSIVQYLDIHTRFILSSSIPINNQLKSSDKVKEICKQRKADIYINPIGGTELYNKEDFKKNNLELKFHNMNNFVYSQFDNEFISSLSIIDVMMFNNKALIHSKLNSYSLF